MAQDNIPPELQKLLPGAIGSLGALLWIKGTWPRRIAMVALGSSASFYGAPHIAGMFGMGEGLAGFLLGLFGMSVVDSIFKTWQELGLTAILREFIRTRLGLSPKGE
jgi:hypothetical protein